MRSVRTTLAYVAAALVVAAGLLSLLNPLVAVRVLGLEVIEPRGLSEVRANYGAFLLVLGGALLWAIPMRPRGASWLRLSGLTILGAALGRGVSVVLDGVFTPLNLAMLAATAFVGAVTLLASFQRRGRDEGRTRQGTGMRPRTRRRRGERDASQAGDEGAGERTGDTSRE